MDTSRELNYRMYLQQEEGFERSSLQSEFSRYDAIKNGDVETVERMIAERRQTYYAGKGQLSDDPLRNNIYHMVVATGIIARVCIDAGMPHNESYTLSDIYIRKADRLRNPEAVVDLLYEMQLDYTVRMQKIHHAKKGSVYVTKAVDYIYDHLNESLTMEGLAHQVGLNPSYFSKLFSAETGTTVKKYINQVKIRTATEMLKDINLAIIDISFSLGYSSQSAFSAVFKKHLGVTPGEYRRRHIGFSFPQMEDSAEK